MAIATQEQSVVDKVAKQLYIGGEWRDASGGETLAGRGPGDRETLCEWPTDARGRRGGARRRRRDAGGVGRHPAQRALGDPRRAFELLNERADDLALLMTLEMGKAVAESKAEIAYSAEFFRWFSGEALRPTATTSRRQRRRAASSCMRQPIGPSVLHHALELPDGDGNPQGRPRGRRRLHDGLEAGEAARPSGPRARPAARGGRAPAACSTSSLAPRRAPWPAR